MKAIRRCWWCGLAAEIDTENPEPHNGLVRDTETSWLCTDNDGCNQRFLEIFGLGRERKHDAT